MDTNRCFLVMFTIVVFALSGCASPGTSATAAAQAGEKAGEKTAEVPLAEDDPNRIVCRREHVVGSNFTRRVCRTVREIEEERLASQQKLDQERTRMLQKALPPPRN